MLAINEILQGRYRILRRLGHGGMGAVYEAMDERFGSPVALKEIIIDLDRVHNASQQAMMRQAFEREARILAHLHHEAFPHVRDYFSETDRQFLVMELIGGDDLADLLARRQEPFLLEDVLKWADQLLDALDYLHTLEMPVIHRDLKPQNLKLTARGKIKLLDFGIAKGTDAQIANTITNKTFIAATLNYSPLEQILPVLDPSVREFIIYSHGEKVDDILQQPTDARSDLYALGATLYHLSTGAVPTDVLKRTLEIWAGKPDPLPNPATVNPNIPKAVSDVLLKAMEVERGNRYNSAKEMREALSQAAATRRTVEEEARYLLWLAHQDQLKAEQDRLNNEAPALQTQQQTPENQAAGITDPVAAAVPTQNSSEFTRQSYLAAILPEPPKPEPAKEETSVRTLPAADKNVAAAPPKNRKNLWLLPVAALFLLTLGGAIFGMWWIMGKTVNETAKPTPTSTGTPESVVEATPELPTSTFDSSVVVPAQSPSITPTSQTPTSQTPTSTPRLPIASTPAPAVSTPTPRLSTPPPKTPPPARTPPPTPRPQSGCPQAPPRGCRQLPSCVIEC
ncbi:MAG TPA: protein kinase [Pyrinomonadaceae bacterium]|jgi:serine/threonine protein kinase